MNHFLSDQNLNMNEEARNKIIHFSNVFSTVKKPEKSNQYQKLRANLNLLSKDVKLLGDYINKNNSEKNKRFDKSLNRIIQYKKFVARSSFLMRKKKNAGKANVLNVIIDYINSKNTNSAKKKTKTKRKQSSNKSRNTLIYKTQINKSSNLGNGLPKLNFAFDKSSETNVDSSRNNINISNTFRLPVVRNKNSKHIYFYTDDNENKEEYNNKIYRQYYEPSKNISIDKNSFIKKYPKILNNNKLKNGINRYELGNSAEKMVKIINDKNTKIKNKINYKLAEQELIDWEIKSKLKFAKWKFGVAEIEKYFVDLKAYGKPEEEELLKRKTFYDAVEDLIDELKQEKEEREMKDLKKNYDKKTDKDFNDIDKGDKKAEQNNDINMVDNIMNKHSEVSQSLQKVKARKLNEARARNLINNILVQSELGRKAINRSTEKLYNDKYYNYLNIINSGDKNNKLKKKEDDKINKGILIIKDKEKLEERTNNN